MPRRRKRSPDNLGAVLALLQGGVGAAQALEQGRQDAKRQKEHEEELQRDKQLRDLLSGLPEFNQDPDLQNMAKLGLPVSTLFGILEPREEFRNSPEGDAGKRAAQDPYTMLKGYALEAQYPDADTEAIRSLLAGAIYPKHKESQEAAKAAQQQLDTQENIKLRDMLSRGRIQMRDESRAARDAEQESRRSEVVDAAGLTGAPALAYKYGLPRIPTDKSDPLTKDPNKPNREKYIADQEKLIDAPERINARYSTALKQLYPMYEGLISRLSPQEVLANPEFTVGIQGAKPMIDKAQVNSYVENLRSQEFLQITSDALGKFPMVGQDDQSEEFIDALQITIDEAKQRIQDLEDDLEDMRSGGIDY